MTNKNPLTMLDKIIEEIDNQYDFEEPYVPSATVVLASIRPKLDKLREALKNAGS